MNANGRKSVAKDHMIFICPQITQIFTDCFVFNLASSADRLQRPAIFSMLNPNLSDSTCHRQ